ncbi:hypothetical protein D3C78_1113990 [compost metagenome]
MRQPVGRMPQRRLPVGGEHRAPARFAAGHVEHLGLALELALRRIAGGDRTLLAALHHQRGIQQFLGQVHAAGEVAVVHAHPGRLPELPPRHALDHQAGQEQRQHAGQQHPGDRQHQADLQQPELVAMVQLGQVAEPGEGGFGWGVGHGASSLKSLVAVGYHAPGWQPWPCSSLGMINELLWWLILHSHHNPNSHLLRRG